MIAILTSQPRFPRRNLLCLHLQKYCTDKRQITQLCFLQISGNHRPCQRITNMAVYNSRSIIVNIAQKRLIFCFLQFLQVCLLSRSDNLIQILPFQEIIKSPIMFLEILDCFQPKGKPDGIRHILQGTSQSEVIMGIAFGIFRQNRFACLISLSQIFDISSQVPHLFITIETPEIEYVRIFYAIRQISTTFFKNATHPDQQKRIV